jgi:tRNA pseudouridine55 synthase
MRGVLIVDKAEGPSSHDVVRVARRAFGTRAVGHAGTLDPMASGVLVLGLGEGTKLLAHLSGVDKIYTATLQLGAETDTLDARGQVVEEAAVPSDLDRAQVQAVAERFIGETVQRAPEISAIKQAGLPLYARVRRGETVVAPERTVFVHSLAIERVEGGAIAFRVHCAKGFYVRALGRDLARALGSCGHLTQLRRVASGAFALEDALACDVLAAAGRGDPAARETARGRVLPLATALASVPQLTVTPEGAEDIRHGRAIARQRVADGEFPSAAIEPVALLDATGELLAIGRADGERVFVVRGMQHA